jgi:hypothetical protein
MEILSQRIQDPMNYNMLDTKGQKYRMGKGYDMKGKLFLTEFSVGTLHTNLEVSLSLALGSSVYFEYAG